MIWKIIIGIVIVLLIIFIIRKKNKKPRNKGIGSGSLSGQMKSIGSRFLDACCSHHSK